MSAGLKLVLRFAMELVGVCRDRILDRVERSFRRKRPGRRIGIEGHVKGILEVAKKRSLLVREK